MLIRGQKEREEREGRGRGRKRLGGNSVSEEDPLAHRQGSREGHHIRRSQRDIVRRELPESH